MDESKANRWEDIKVSRGTYHVTEFLDTGLINVHFYPASAGKAYELMLILDGEAYHESSRNEDGNHAGSKAKRLRSGLPELQDTELPVYIKSILAKIK